MFDIKIESNCLTITTRLKQKTTGNNDKTGTKSGPRVTGGFLQDKWHHLLYTW
jgi:hypothetical protein